ncbi:superoxide dismutase family protein [Nocardia sp. NPDC052316]|uniref:superoxide dismutase family protein n=1 Tax=Nocardia sp. NPDC052316 TaxID=3364329 RepID=UPI0037C7A473
MQTDVSGITPGFHGFHVHERGVCEPNSTAPEGGATGDFQSAGGHMQVAGHTGYPASFTPPPATSAIFPNDIPCRALVPSPTNRP